MHCRCLAASHAVSTACSCLGPSNVEFNFALMFGLCPPLQLQRLRDLVRTWTDDTAEVNKDFLQETRRSIEVQMVSVPLSIRKACKHLATTSGCRRFTLYHTIMYCAGMVQGCRARGKAEAILQAHFVPGRKAGCSHNCKEQHHAMGAQGRSPALRASRDYGGDCLPDDIVCHAKQQ